MCVYVFQLGISWKGLKSSHTALNVTGLSHKVSFLLALALCLALSFPPCSFAHRLDHSLLSVWGWKSIPSGYFFFIFSSLSALQTIYVKTSLSAYHLTCTSRLSSYTPTSVTTVSSTFFLTSIHGPCLPFSLSVHFFTCCIPHPSTHSPIENDQQGHSTCSPLLFFPGTLSVLFFSLCSYFIPSLLPLIS